MPRRKKADIIPEPISDTPVQEVAIPKTDEFSELDSVIEFEAQQSSEESPSDYGKQEQLVNAPAVKKKRNQKNIVKSIDFSNVVGAFANKFQTQDQFDEFVQFYRSTAAKLDPLVNECAAMRMLLAAEMGKPTQDTELDNYEEAGGGNAESYVQNVVLENTLTSSMRAMKVAFEFDDVTATELTQALIDALTRPILRYGDYAVREYIAEQDNSKYRDPTLCVKLANTITMLEKARQNIDDSMAKGQVEVRFNLFVYRVMSVIEKVLDGQPQLLRRVYLGIDEIAKDEGLQVNWAHEPQQEER